MRACIFHENPNESFCALQNSLDHFPSTTQLRVVYISTPSLLFRGITALGPTTPHFIPTWKIIFKMNPLLILKCDL